MSTEEVIRIINNSTIKTLSEFMEKAPKLFPDVDNFSIIHKQDMGLSGIIGTARFNVGMDDVIVKGFLYPTNNWTPETHGYVIAKKI